MYKEILHYIEFAFHGRYPWNAHEVQPFQPGDELKIPVDCIGYRFFDKILYDEGDEEVIGARRNITGYTYLGEEYTVEEIESNFPDKSPFIKWLKDNGYKRAVKTYANKWVPLEETDQVRQPQ